MADRVSRSLEMTEKDRNGTTSTYGATAPPLPPTPPPQQQYEYGTFQGVASYSQPPSQPVVGFPQPTPPPGAFIPSSYYPHAYQTVPGNCYSILYFLLSFTLFSWGI